MANEKINLKIEMGTHTMAIPDDLEKVVIRAIKFLGIKDGDFKLNLGEQVRGSKHSSQTVKLIKILPRFCALRVKIQSAGKDSMHVCILYFPTQYSGQELEKFAALLSKEVKQEDLPNDDTVLGPDGVPPIDGDTEQQQGSIAKVVGSIPLAEMSHQQVPGQEIITLLIDEIYTKCGTNWTHKHKLFDIIKAAKVDYPENKLIGIFFRLNYLERNPDKPNTSSRLTSVAIKLIDKDLPAVAVVPDSASVISEEETKNLRAIGKLQSIKSAHDELLHSQEKALAELESLMEQDLLLANELSRITALLAENTEKTHQKQEEISNINQQITPQMIKAREALEILASIGTSL